MKTARLRICTLRPASLNAGDLFPRSYRQSQSRVCCRRWRPRTHMYSRRWNDRSCVRLRARVRVGASRNLCRVRAKSAPGLSWLRVWLPDGQTRNPGGVSHASKLSQSDVPYRWPGLVIFAIHTDSMRSFFNCRLVLHVTPLLSFPALSAGVQIFFPSCNSRLRKCLGRASWADIIQTIYRAWPPRIQKQPRQKFDT
jgi:hypothetical protein